MSFYSVILDLYKRKNIYGTMSRSNKYRNLLNLSVPPTAFNNSNLIFLCKYISLLCDVTFQKGEPISIMIGYS